MKLVITVSGVSGSGKSYLIASLCQNPAFVRIPSVTTRKPRDGEVHLRDKEFLTEEAFRHRVSSGKLLCVANNFGAMYAHNRDAITGTSSIPVIELAHSSLGEFAEAFPDAISILVIPSDARHAISAISSRSDDGTFVNERKSEVHVDNRRDSARVTQFMNTYDESSLTGFRALVERLVRSM